LGYVPAANGDIEPGYSKVAIYLDGNGVPTHAARQLPDGRWTSKLGRNVDIRHERPEDVGGGLYGEPIIYMKRHNP
jgi:hypothetical protein